MAYERYVIKVKDSEFDDIGNEFLSYGNALNVLILNYIIYLSEISLNAVSSGSTHDAIVCFVEYISKIKDIANELGQKFKVLSDDYVYNKIDKADDYLYETGMSVIRDFSNSEYKKLMKMLNDLGRNDGK